MNYLKQFRIPVSGLKVGNHTFTFEIDHRFFESFDYSEIQRGQVRVECLLEKQVRMMIFHFEMKGEVTVICDRCGGEFGMPVEGSNKLIVKYGAEHHEESEEIMVITDKENDFDISQFIYEYIHLLLPIRKVHGEDENGQSLCDPDVIKYITEEN